MITSVAVEAEMEMYDDFGLPITRSRGNICLPVEIDENGSFFICLRGTQKRIPSHEGLPLCRENLPDGCWPVFIGIWEQGIDLYWSFFLSATCHAWRLDKDLRRLTGRGVSRLEIEDIRNLFGTSISGYGAWALKKFSREMISFDDISKEEQHNDFMYLELLVLKSLFNEAQNTDKGNFDFFGNFCKELETVPGRQKMVIATAGYDEPLNLDLDPTDGEMVGKLGGMLAAYRILRREVLSDITLMSRTNFFSISVAGFRDLPSQECVIVRMQPEKRLISLWFHNKLLEDFREQFVRRLRLGIVSIWPEILKLAATLGHPADIPISFRDTGDEGMLSPDRNITVSQILGPDLYILGKGKGRIPPLCSVPREIFDLEFSRKNKVLFWRGSSTGDGEISSLDMLRENRRVRACVHIAKTMGTLADCKIVMLTVQSSILDDARFLLEELGIFSKIVSEDVFADYQMFLDIAGNAAAWGTYLRYLQGCLVFRVKSNRELLYYSSQKPWVHFIPVSEDLSDLESGVVWALRNQKEAAAIAYSGRAHMVDFINNISDQLYSAIKNSAKPV